MIVILTCGPPKSPICFDAQVILATGGILVGATVVSQGAGEIASELGLAISKKMKFLGLKAQDIELYLISHDITKFPLFGVLIFCGQIPYLQGM